MPMLKSSSTKFNLLNIIVKNFYSAIVQLSISTILFTLIHHAVNKTRSFDYKEFIPVIFFLNCLIISLTLASVARKINSLLQAWMNHNNNNSDDYDNYDNGVIDASDIKILGSRRILTAFMMTALIEHLLSKATDYEGTSRCFHRYNSSFEGFSRGIIPAFFQIFPYTHVLGAFIIVTCFYSTVIWNFGDVFLITVYYFIRYALKKFMNDVGKMKYRVSIFF